MGKARSTSTGCARTSTMRTRSSGYARTRAGRRRDRGRGSGQADHHVARRSDMWKFAFLRLFTIALCLPGHRLGGRGALARHAHDRHGIARRHLSCLRRGACAVADPQTRCAGRHPGNRRAGGKPQAARGGRDLSWPSSRSALRSRDGAAPLLDRRAAISQRPCAVSDVRHPVPVRGHEQLRVCVRNSAISPASRSELARRAEPGASTRRCCLVP